MLRQEQGSSSGLMNLRVDGAVVHGEVFQRIEGQKSVTHHSSRGGEGGGGGGGGRGWAGLR